MAEPRYFHSTNGQEVDQDDLNLLGETGALADDHVLAELLRLAPFGTTVSKAVLPFAHAGSARATVSPAGAAGAVLVSPFRAIVGSRAPASAIGTKAHWHDLRSGLFTAQSTLTLLPNGSGFSRWDLVYAQLAVDASGPNETRYRKDPVNETVSVLQVPRTKVQTITLGVLTGTPDAAPQRPALPVDAGGNFYFPLAFVRVPDGFTATSLVGPSDIDEQIPYVPLSRTMGANTTVTANKQRGYAWRPNAGHRPRPYLPPTMVGAETLLIALDFGNGPADWSHGNGSIIDDSRDWRNRVFQWTAHVRSAAATTYFAWDRGAPLNPSLVPQATLGSTLGQRVALGVGQSFRADGADANSCVAAFVDSTVATELAAGARVQLYVDRTDGALKLLTTGLPAALLFVWLTATGPYPNA